MPSKAFIHVTVGLSPPHQFAFGDREMHVLLLATSKMSDSPLHLIVGKLSHPGDSERSRSDRDTCLAIRTSMICRSGLSRQGR
jgi:hypothetical protein